MMMEFSKTFMRELELDLEYPVQEVRTLSVHQFEEGECGCILWDAGIVMLQYLTTPKGREHVKGKNVIELGSGTGAVGIAAKAVGAHAVVVTDMLKYLPLMEHNIKCNLETAGLGKNAIFCKQKCNVKSFVSNEDMLSAACLNWGNKDDLKCVYSLLPMHATKPVCILISDCVYYEDGLELLVDTISMLFQTFTSCEVLCSFEHRDTGNKKELLNKFLHLLENVHKFILSYIPLSDMHETFRSEDISILHICAKS